MPFISASEGLIKKSTTTVENTFITQYLPALDPTAVKVYLYSLFLCQSGSPYTLKELAKTLEITENEAIGYFEYLEEYELVSIISRSPLSVSVLEISNFTAKPKRIKPEKYSDFNKSVQSILSGRMVPPDEYLEYYKLLEECGFEQQALLMIIAFCADQNKDKAIKFKYIKTVAESYAENGKLTASQVDGYLANDRLLFKILEICGLTRKVNHKDREYLEKWRGWGFSDEMLFEAAKISTEKSSPVTYMNGVLSKWKKDGIFSTDKIPAPSASSSAPVQNNAQTDERAMRAEIERHYFDLRHTAEDRADNALTKATADKIYGEIRKQLSELSIQLAFAEIGDKAKAEKIANDIKKLELAENKRLAELSIDKADFIPRYSCKICNDTGYDKNGKPCACLKKFIATLK